MRPSGVDCPSLHAKFFSTCATMESAPLNMQEILVHIATVLRPTGWFEHRIETADFVDRHASACPDIPRPHPSPPDSHAPLHPARASTPPAPPIAYDRAETWRASDRSWHATFSDSEFAPVFCSSIVIENLFEPPRRKDAKKIRLTARRKDAKYAWVKPVN